MCFNGFPIKHSKDFLKLTTEGDERRIFWYFSPLEKAEGYALGRFF